MDPALTYEKRGHVAYITLNRIEDECALEVMRSEDAREGPRAFIEKREPQYKGR